MSTITTINDSDLLSDAPTALNANFDNLNDDKLEASDLTTPLAAKANSASPTFTGTVTVPATTTTTNFTLDIQGQGTVTVVNNAEHTLFANNFSGLIIITNPNINGNTGLISAGADVALINGGSGSKFTITKDNASTTNIYKDGSGNIIIQNKLGFDGTYNVMSLRTRNAI